MGEYAVALWLTTVALLGISTFAMAVRFATMHRRRYGLYLSDAERIGLFLSNPIAMLKRAVPDGSARGRSLLSAVDDPAIEQLRRRTLTLAAVTAAWAILGLPAVFLAVGVARRLPSIGPDEWAIVLLWAILLVIAIRRRASRLAVAFIGVALLVSAVIGFVTGLE